MSRADWRTIEELKVAACEWSLGDQKKIWLMPGFLEWVCDEIEEVRLRTNVGRALYRRRPDPPLKYFAALIRKGTWRFPQLIGESE
jgi:hypothetical protein